MRFVCVNPRVYIYDQCMSDLGYPMIQARATNYSRGRAGSIIWIIIHCTAQPYQNNYPERLGQYWARENTGVSVHYGVSDTQVYQYVKHADTAYQARNPGNSRGVGIEFSGLASYSRNTWLSHDAMLRKSGALIRQIANRHGIPLKLLSQAELKSYRSGITTHNDLRIAFGGSHVDPGPGFPLDVVLAYAKTDQPQPPEEDEDMGGDFLGPFAIPTDTHKTCPINPVEVGAANPRPAWLNIVNDTYGKDYVLRIWATMGDGSFYPIDKLADPGRVEYLGDGESNKGVWKFRSGFRGSFPLPKGTVGLTISRQDDFDGPLEAGVEYGAVIR